MPMKQLQRVAVTILSCFTVYVTATAQSFIPGIQPDKLPHSVAQIHTHKADSLSSSSLLADGKGLVEQINEKRRKQNEALEDAILRESLEYPAIDLYGENSWGRYVNPFAGGATAAEIPATYEIDCSGFIMPLDGAIRITSNYGYRKRFGRMHRGMDIGLHTGDTVRSAFDGKVRIVDYEGGGYGKYVVIRHPNGLETVYGHMSRHLVRENEVVRAGEAIGLGGSTGRSTGPHLHFECRFMGIDINPTQIIDFANGSPLRDIYTFRRGATTRAASSYASAGSAKNGYKKSNAQKSHKPQVYRIRKGDTLSGISKKTGVPVKKLCQINKISTKTTIREGKTLRIR